MRSFWELLQQTEFISHLSLVWSPKTKTEQKVVLANKRALRLRSHPAGFLPKNQFLHFVNNSCHSAAPLEKEKGHLYMAKTCNLDTGFRGTFVFMTPTNVPTLTRPSLPS